MGVKRRWMFAWLVITWRSETMIDIPGLIAESGSDMARARSLGGCDRRIATAKRVGVWSSDRVDGVLQQEPSSQVTGHPPGHATTRVNLIRWIRTQIVARSDSACAHTNSPIPPTSEVAVRPRTGVASLGSQVDTELAVPLREFRYVLIER
jgi:hypothetical protein